MDNKGIGGIVLSFVLVLVVAGFLVFNQLNPSTSPVNNAIVMVNQTGNNNTTNISNILPLHGATVNALVMSSSSGNLITQNPTLSAPSYMDTILAKFDIYVEKFFRENLIPASAVIIVKDGNVIYQKCLGVKEYGAQDAVNEDTLFQIGSCSKAITSANIAQLVDLGIMHWNDTVRSYFTPEEFQLYNTSISDEITLRDLLCHCSGLPASSGDQLWMYFNYTYPDVLYHVRYLENNTVFRSTFQYHNIMYSLAGECAYRAAENAGLGYSSWQDMIKEMIFKPMGMNTATADFNEFSNSSNRVHTYVNLNGTITEWGPLNVEEIKGAGSIAFSINDMGKWLKLQLANGNFNGLQVVSSEELTKTKTPQIQMDSTNWYGFGWAITPNGIITHSGNVPPSKTLISLDPVNNLAFAVVSDEDNYGVAFNKALYLFFNNLYQTGQVNESIWTELRDSASETAKETTGKLPDPPSPPEPAKSLSTYVGIYVNTFYGNVNVTSSGGKLILFMGNSTEPTNLEHWSGDVFKIEDNPFTYNTAVNFTNIDGSGKSQQVTVDYLETGYGANGTFNRTS
nr:serine hydrolase [uncultured Methanobacterium sp.]